MPLQPTEKFGEFGWHCTGMTAQGSSVSWQSATPSSRSPTVSHFMVGARWQCWQRGEEDPECF
jgi:hypothetical protein